MPTPISGNSPVNPLDYQVDPIQFVNTPAAVQSSIQASSTAAVSGSLKVSLPVPDMSWADYLSIVSSNLAASKRQLQESQIADDLATQEQYIVLAQAALNNINLLAQLQQQIITAATQASILATQIDALVPAVNSAIDDYNDGTGNQASFVNSEGNTVTVTDNGLDSDQSEWNRLNNATTTYNNVINDPDSTQAQKDAALAKYGDAINRYNLYVSLRQPTIDNYNTVAGPSVPNGSNYNSLAERYNQAIGVLNDIGAATGIDPIPEQDILSTVNNLGPYGSIGAPLPPQPPNTEIDHVDTTSDKISNAAETYNDYYNSVVKTLQKALKDAAKKLQMNENFSDLIKYFIGNMAKIDAPAAYINVNQGSTSKLASTGSSVLGDALTNNNLIEILSQSLTNQQQQTVSNPAVNIVQPKVINELGIAFLQVLGLSAVIPSLALLSEKFGNLGPYSKALDTALQAQSISQVVGALHVGDVLDQLEAALKLRFPDLKDGDIQAILSGLQIAFVVVLAKQLGDSLGLPGLTSQLLALASGKSESESVADQNKPITLDNSLNNQAVLQQIQQILVNNAQVSANSANKAVIDAAIQSQQKQQEIDSAANRADAQLQDLKRIDNFQNGVLASLKQQGIENDQVQKAAIQSGDLLRSQLQSSQLQSTQLNADNLRFDILQQSLAASLKQAQIVKSDDDALALAKQVSPNVFGSSRNLTDSQIRNNLEIELPKADATITPQQATVVANAAVIVPKVPEGVNPLTQPNISQGLSKPEVALGLTERVIQELTPSVGYTKASEIASEVTRSQVGTADQAANQKSALSVLTDQTHFVNSLQNKSEAQVAANTFSDFIAPHSSLSDLAEKIRSPATALTFDGIMYSHPTATPGMGQGRDVPATSIQV